MKAILCNKLGGPEHLTVNEIKSPSPGPKDVLVRVKAAGLNFADTLQIAGKYQSKLEPPFIPGMEVAGEILQLGSDVNRPLKIGQRVMAFIRGGGAFAERALVHSEWLTPIPDEMDDIIAAGFSTVYGTSNFALKHRGKLKIGETLLVLGAAGGVGLAAVELGKHMGACVIAAAGGDAKCKLTLEYGADYAIDYKTVNIRDRVREITGGTGADVVYDAVGGDQFDQAIRAVNWEARMLLVGFASGRIQQIPANLILVKNISVVGVVYGAQTEKDPTYGASFVKDAADLYKKGKIKPHVGKTFPLANAAEAMNALKSRSYSGKIILIT
jgi:NADPH2:quinone reductase